jgi:hypothetical protein
MAVARPAQGLAPGAAGDGRAAGGVAPAASRPRVAARPAEAVGADEHFRRCTFRRLDPVRVGGRGPAVRYLVTCLYGGPDAALSLGDLGVARPACAACRAPGTFRPDEG